MSFHQEVCSVIKSETGNNGDHCTLIVRHQSLWAIEHTHTINTDNEIKQHRPRSVWL